MEKQNIFRLRVRMMDPKGILIPKGVTEELIAEIGEEVAIFHFKNPSTTKRFALVVIKLENQRGVKDTTYLPRINKIMTHYKGKTKEEIRDLILEQLKQLGANVKK